VAVIGGFNRWQPEAGRLHLARPGVWQTALPRPRRGTYAYKFLVDGQRWQPDAENPAQGPDGCGGLHSLLVVE
jgi:hypothetical protein